MLLVLAQKRPERLLAVLFMLLDQIRKFRKLGVFGVICPVSLHLPVHDSTRQSDPLFLLPPVHYQISHSDIVVIRQLTY